MTDADTKKCRRCSECIGEEHHWLSFLPSYADTEPDHPAVAAGHDCWIDCKHCEAWREAREDDG